MSEEPESKSEIADLKNSVKERMNAQSSCAAQFVAEHLGVVADHGCVDVIEAARGSADFATDKGLYLGFKSFGFFRCHLCFPVVMKRGARTGGGQPLA